jgi:hypothetical protein
VFYKKNTFQKLDLLLKYVIFSRIVDSRQSPEIRNLIETNEVGGSCSLYGGEESVYRVFGGET